jgi:hypothetical protein
MVMKGNYRDSHCGVHRALCYNAGLKGSKLGQFNRTIVPGGEIGLVYGIAYEHNGM